MYVLDMQEQLVQCESKAWSCLFIHKEVLQGGCGPDIYVHCVDMYVSSIGRLKLRRPQKELASGAMCLLPGVLCQPAPGK